SPESQSGTHPSDVVQFGIFELNRRAGELRKHGIRIRLQPKPMQILCALLERPGEIVIRDALKARLWPDDTFVDFESGLNTAVNRLRLALGDSAEHPRYIETEARSGYRFIGAAERKPEPALSLSPQLIAPEASAQRRVLLRWQFAAVLGFLVIAVTAAIGFRPPDSPVTFRQITFRRGQVSGARFGEGPRNMLYAAQWEDGPRRIYEAHVGDPVSRILGFEGLSLVAVSPLGEVAGMRPGGAGESGGGGRPRGTGNVGPQNKSAERNFYADLR